MKKTRLKTGLLNHLSTMNLLPPEGIQFKKAKVTFQHFYIRYCPELSLGKKTQPWAKRFETDLKIPHNFNKSITKYFLVSFCLGSLLKLGKSW